MSMLGSFKFLAFLGDVKLARAYLGDNKVYSSGNVVTYISNGKIYAEEYDEGANVLSPSSFAPTMAGATFKGWSNSPNSTQVLTLLTMGDEPITLYAVFKIADSIKYLSFDIQEYSKVISTTGTYHSIYTGVDKSLYSGAKLALSYMDAETHYAYSRLYLRFTDGSVSAQIANVYNDGEVSSIVSSNLNPAITFANATGTANLSLLAISAGTGAGYEGATQADYVLQGGTLTLIGRTIVSSAVEEEPEPEPEAVLLTSDGYTLQDINGVYLTTKEDE